jgi:hypothetical protein
MGTEGGSTTGVMTERGYYADHAAIAALRARDDRDIQVVQTDLPGNDWATFFDNLEHDPRSYWRAVARTYPTVVGCSFYERVVPASPDYRLVTGRIRRAAS